MTLIKYIFTLLLCLTGFSYSYGQCTVPSSNPYKFEVLNADNKVEDQQAKILTGRVVFLISDLILKADSAVVYSNNGMFEAFGNVTLTKNGENYQTGQKAIYRQDAHIILLDDAEVQVGSIKSNVLKPTETVYNISR